VPSEAPNKCSLCPDFEFSELPGTWRLFEEFSNYAVPYASRNGHRDDETYYAFKKFS